jgi:hypothetical protein
VGFAHGVGMRGYAAGMKELPGDHADLLGTEPVRHR